MNTLINKQPSRFFAFGCSFTHYNWATWANILAYELECEFYNFGKSGAGNSFIANQISQADACFNFNENDLVVVSWTNISREDRWQEDRGWVTPGNIYSQQDYDNKFIKKWANDAHFALRDFSAIHFSKNLLENKTNWRFIQMCDIKTVINQWEPNQKSNKNVAKIADLYKSSIQHIYPSFYDVLWRGDVGNKWKKDWKEIHPHYSDGHPTPFEHLQYLERTIAPTISTETKHAVHKLNKEWCEYIREGYKNTKKDCGLHDLPSRWVDEMNNMFKLKEENPIPPEIFH